MEPAVRAGHRVPSPVHRSRIHRQPHHGIRLARKAPRTVDERALLDATGLESTLVDQAFSMVAGAERLIICWAMGITQHLDAIPTIDEMTISRFSEATSDGPEPVSVPYADTVTRRLRPDRHHPAKPLDAPTSTAVRRARS